MTKSRKKLIQVLAILLICLSLVHFTTWSRAMNISLTHFLLGIQLLILGRLKKNESFYWDVVAISITSLVMEIALVFTWINFNILGFYLVYTAIFVVLLLYAAKIVLKSKNQIVKNKISVIVNITVSLFAFATSYLTNYYL